MVHSSCPIAQSKYIVPMIIALKITISWTTDDKARESPNHRERAEPTTTSATTLLVHFSSMTY